MSHHFFILTKKCSFGTLGTLEKSYTLYVQNKNTFSILSPERFIPTLTVELLVLVCSSDVTYYIHNECKRNPSYLVKLFIRQSDILSATNCQFSSTIVSHFVIDQKVTCIFSVVDLSNQLNLVILTS